MGKSGWAVRAELPKGHGKASSALPPSSTRVFTRLSRVSTSPLPPSLIGRRLKACAAAVFRFPFRSQLAADLHLPWLSTSTPLGYKQLTGSLARWLLRSLVSHSFVVDAMLLVNGKLRLQVRVPVPSARSTPNSIFLSFALLGC